LPLLILDAAADAAAGRTLLAKNISITFWMVEFSSSSRLERFSLPGFSAPQAGIELSENKDNPNRLAG